MLRKEQIEFLKNELIEMKHTLNDQQERNKADSLEGIGLHDSSVGGELSLYDNHPADAGTALFDRTKDYALEEHNDSELNKINQAIEAIENKTYGKCIVCGAKIPYERLKAVPATLYCIEHSSEQKIPTDRPVEEKVLEPAHSNYFQHRHHREVIDNEDSFQEVARYGTSETPSDLRGDYESYESLYNEGHDDEGFTTDIETFLASDITGTERSVYHSKKHEEYEAYLDGE